LTLHQRAWESWENIQGAESLVCLLGGVPDHISNVFMFNVYACNREQHVDAKVWSKLSYLWVQLWGLLRHLCQLLYGLFEIFAN